MPVVTAGLYSVILHQEIQQNPILNVFWYLEAGGSDTAAGNLGSLFDGAIPSVLAPSQHTGVSYTLLTTKPVFGTGLEDNRVPTQSGGTLAGSGMSDAYAYSLRLLRSTTETRSGWKRFAGIVEEQTAQRTFSASYLTLMDAVGAVLDDRLSTAGQTPDRYVRTQKR